MTGVQDRRLRLAAVAGALWIAAYGVATLLVGADGRDAAVIDVGGNLLPIAGSIVLLILAARASTGPRRRAWGLLALANGCWLAGELTWAAFELFTGEVPSVSIADGLYLLSGILAIPAVALAFRSSGQAPGWRSVLDASVLLVALAAGAAILLVAPQLAGPVGLATLISVTYPMLDVLLVFTVISQGFGAYRRLPRSITLIGAAYAVIAVTDAAYAYFIMVLGSAVDLWLNVGYQAGSVLLCLAALSAVVRPEALPAPTEVDHDPGLALVLAGLGATVCLVLADLTAGPLNVAVALAAAYAVVAVSVRLLVTSREKDATTRRLHEALLEQGRLAVTDALTGLHNRRFVGETLRLETERALRAGRPLGLLIIDLDHFKEVNDRCGHQSGDTVLVEAARRMAQVGRTGDVVARYGGEEFVMVIPECEIGDLFEVAERVREAIGSRAIEVDGMPGGWRLTASVGGALLPDHAGTEQELLQVADRAVYAAKAAGRDRVHLGPSRVAAPGVTA